MPSTVLIVDDHARFRRAAQALLEAEGYEVIAESATGGEALEAADRAQPTLVLLDIGLPDIDGIHVAALLTAATVAGQWCSPPAATPRTTSHWSSAAAPADSSPRPSSPAPRSPHSPPDRGARSIARPLRRPPTDRPR